MPELDDEELFGDDASDFGGDDRESRADDDDDESEESPDLEGQFEDEDEDGEEEEKPAAKGADDKGDSKRDGKTVTLSAKEYRELQQRARESEVEQAYWRGKAEAGKRKVDEEEDDAPPGRKAKPASADEEEDDSDLLDAISKGGTKALKARGFVKASDVEAMIEERAAAIAEKVAGRKVTQATEALHSDARLMQQYPDIGKEGSEFQVRVAKEVQAMVKGDKSLKNSPSTIALAARLVDAEMKAEARSRGSENRERERRIAKQGPSSRRSEREDEGYMSPLQRQMLAPAMKAFGISEKAFRQEQARLKGRG
jgi:hypothetical protein